MRREVFIAQDVIQKKVRDLGARISTDYRHREPVFIGVLKGAVFFFADLVRAVTIPVKMDFIRARSYGAEMQTCGRVEITMDAELPLAGKHVILVEDIVDTGFTVAAMIEHIMKTGAADCAVCALIDKKERRRCEIRIDYPGFSLQRGFVVGYGLDYNERYRYLRDIYVLKPCEDGPGGIQNDNQL